jgi:hypothetical protein
MLLLDGHSGVSQIQSHRLNTDDQVTKPRPATAMSTGVSNRQLADRFQPHSFPTPRQPSSISPKSCHLTRPPDRPTRHT